MITTGMQIQTLGDLLHNQKPVLTRDQLDEDFAWLYDVIGNSETPFQELARLKLDTEYEDLFNVIDRIMSVEPGFRPRYPTLADIGPQLPDVTWLWDGWVPRGYITMLAAWPGIGKTYIALDLADRLIRAKLAPDGSHFKSKNRRVIYVDAEDFLPVAYKRAEVWGMDMNSFIPIKRPPRDLIDMSKRDHQDLLIEMAHNLQPDLIIVDSLSSVNSKGENNIEDLREVLSFFTEVARHFDCGFILVHHLRKPGKNNTNPVSMHDLRGTGHLTAMARTILGLDLISRTDDPNGPRVLKTLKNNLSKYAKPLGVMFEPTEHPDVAQLSYDDVNAFWKPEPNAADIAAEWLLNQLEENGPMAYGSLAKALKAEFGFAENTLQNARSKLGEAITDTVGRKQSGNKWALASVKALDDDELPF